MRSIISTINRIRRKFTRINLFDNEEIASATRYHDYYFNIPGRTMDQGISLHLLSFSRFINVGQSFVSWRGSRSRNTIRDRDSSIIRAREQSPGIGRDSRLFRLCMDRVLVTRVTRCIRAMPRMAREY